MAFSNPAAISLAGAANGLAQPLHGEFDILGLRVSPAFDLGLVPVLRVAFEIFPGVFSGGRLLLGELLADEWIFGHHPENCRCEGGHAPVMAQI
jgi:hypothetical protein